MHRRFSSTTMLNPLFLPMLVALLPFLATVTTALPCSASDTTIQRDRAFICGSLVQGKTWWCGNEWQNATKAKKDWPSQAVYLQNLLDTLSSTNALCKNTSYYHATVRWLNYSLMDPSISGNFGSTWDVFQVQYYDIPRLPGTRIESPDTLGRKCWAMAYLKQMYNPTKLANTIPYNIMNFTKVYERSIPLTMNLCAKVLTNCFENKTYDPNRNNTCKIKAFEFKTLGFERENIQRQNIVRYPWW